MINFYGRFIKNLSTILSPLYELLKKGHDFDWNENCELAFKQAKEEVVSDNVLTHYNPDLPLKLMCDASFNGIGCVLLHIFPDKTERPIAFASRVLTQSERNYSVVHKEALAVYWGTKKFYQYLMGRKWILVSDHKPLLALFGNKKEYPRWLQGDYNDGRYLCQDSIIHSNISMVILMVELMDCHVCR